MSTREIKIVHSSDWHLGFYPGARDKSGIPVRTLFVLKAAESLVDFVRKNEVDVVLLSGDILNRGNPSPTIQNALAGVLKSLVDSGAKVVYLIGNHEIPGWGDHPVKIYDTLGVPGIIVADKFGIFSLEVKGLPLDIAAIPYSAIIKRDFSSLLEEACSSVEPKHPSILMAHIFVLGARLSGSDLNLLPDEPHAFPDVFRDTPFSYIALGHLHRHQKLISNPPTVYAGSLSRVSFSEANETKGFVFVRLTEENSFWRARWNFVELESPSFITVNVDTTDTANPTEYILERLGQMRLKDAIVRIAITRAASDPKPDIPFIKRTVLKRRALECKVSVNTKYSGLTAEKSLSKAPRKAMGTLDIISEYISSVRKEHLAKKEDILECAKEIIDDLRGSRN